MLKSLGSVLLFAAAALAFACEAEEDSEPLVPSKPGAVQPDAGGDAISETKACDRLAKKRQEVWDDFECEGEELGCPELLRPFGSDPCERYSYDEDSVDACVEQIGDYTSCEDFSRMPCVVTAIVRAGADCEGEGGSPGSAGSGGGGGSAGQAGGGGAG